MKFTRPGGRVEIAARTEDDRLALSVRDTGIGIPEEEQSRLFTRFFRGTQSKEDEVAGTGLGLCIVKQIVDLHGGDVRVASSPQGSTFTILLPLAPPSVDPDRATAPVRTPLPTG